MGYFKFDKLYEVMAKKGVKVTELLNSGVISRDSYYALKRGEYNVSLATICRLCEALDVKPNQIMDYYKGNQEEV